jgi:hypothetical protein
MRRGRCVRTDSMACSTGRRAHGPAFGCRDRATATHCESLRLADTQRLPPPADDRMQPEPATAQSEEARMAALPLPRCRLGQAKRSKYSRADSVKERAQRSANDAQTSLARTAAAQCIAVPDAAAHMHAFLLQLLSLSSVVQTNTKSKLFCRITLERDGLQLIARGAGRGWRSKRRWLRVKCDC